MKAEDSFVFVLTVPRYSYPVRRWKSKSWRKYREPSRRESKVRKNGGKRAYIVVMVGPEEVSDCPFSKRLFRRRKDAMKFAAVTWSILSVYGYAWTRERWMLDAYNFKMAYGTKDDCPPLDDELMEKFGDDKAKEAAARYRAYCDKRSGGADS